jgi:hypothetical protein
MEQIMNIITESEIEQIAIDHLVELGYKYIPGPEIAPDGRMWGWYR